jgi:putative alpha-1,2-mannosidase
MSAWYILTTLGFYPVNPATGDFVFGMPQVKKATLHLKDNKKLVIASSGNSNYKIILNQKSSTKNSISYSQIMNGGTLTFE